MKKNLLSVLILALLVVNVILTSIMMFSVTGTNKKTAAIVTDIAEIISIELADTSAVAEESAAITMENTMVYEFAEPMTISLKQSADGTDHFVSVTITLSMNELDEGYEIYGATIEEKIGVIKGIINDTFNSYTMEEVKADYNLVSSDILAKIQTKFESEFIYEVTFSDILFQ